MASLQDLSAAALAREATLPAVEYEGRWLSWGDLRAIGEQVSTLIADSGIGPGAPVIFISRNRPAALATFLALLTQGRTIKMVYPFQSPAGIARDIARLSAPLVIAAEQEFSAEAREAMRAHGVAGIALSDTSARAVAGRERASHAGGPSTDAPRIEILTSGTTGPPKQFPIRYEMIAESLIGAALEKDWSREPPYLLFAPLGNITGIYTTLPTMIKGQRTMLLDRFTLEGWRDYVVRHRPVHTGVPPAAMQMLLDADIPAEELSSVKAMGFGAAPLDPTLQRQFEERYNIPVLLSYGATEFGGPVTAMTLDQHAQYGKAKFGSVGRPIGGAQLRVVDAETGAVLAPGEEGILEVVSPRIGPDWIRTADVAVVDADGFLFHRGRADGAIMRGGFKILPETIERALLEHKAVSAASVVGVADNRVGQVPGAAIILKPDASAPSAAELEAHLRQRLLATQIPVHWRFVEDLPKTPSFKIDRGAVRALFDV